MDRTSERIPYYDAGDTTQNQNTTVEGIGRTAAIVLGILSGLSLGASLFTMWELTKAERETRMLEYYVLEMDAKLIAAGVKKPEDAVANKLKEK